MKQNRSILSIISLKLFLKFLENFFVNNSFSKNAQYNSGLTEENLGFKVDRSQTFCIKLSNS